MRPAPLIALAALLAGGVPTLAEPKDAAAPAPLPPARPADLVPGGTPEKPAEAKPVPAAVVDDAVPKPPAEPVADPRAICVGAIASLGGRAEPLPPVDGPGGCGVAQPVKLIRLGTLGDGIEVAGGGATLTCPFALTLTRYVALVAGPLVRAHLGAPAKAVDLGPGYACRSRNSIGGAKLSEHALGNAADFSAFLLTDGRRVNVDLPASRDPVTKPFIEALGLSACGSFTTVLAPGADTFHDNHMHVDLGKHGSSDRYRICE